MTTATLERASSADILNKEQEEAKLFTKAQKAATSFLARQGYTILERGWSCLEGTADIICKDDLAIVFAEVKARSGIEKGFPSEEANQRSRNKLELIAMHYLKETDLVDMPVRFDMISIVVLDENKAFLRHHLNAFGC